MADDQFDELRRSAFAIAYRMLGSVSAAEDIVQEGLLRLHRAREGGEQIASPRAYLSTVVSRLALDHLRSAAVRRETYVGDWLPEPLVASDDDDPARKAEMADSLSLAFLVLLESLSPEQRAEVGDRPQVAQLVGVDDRAHGLDLALRDVEDHDADQPALEVVDQRPRLPVDLRAAQDEAAQAGARAQPRRQRTRHTGAAVDRAGEGGRLAAAVAAEHDVVGQQLLERFEIALLGGREEAARQRLALLARRLEPGPPRVDVTARPRDELTGVLLARPDDLRDPVVGLVEHLTQEERGALLGRQALEQDEERERERVGHLRLHGRVAAGIRHQRLRRPRAVAGPVRSAS